MEADQTTESSQPADDASAVAAQSDSGASGGIPEIDVELSSSAEMDAFIRGIPGVSPTSKPGNAEPTGESASTQDDVKPGETTARVRGPDGRFLPQGQTRDPGQEAAPSGDGQEQPQPGRRARAANAAGEQDLAALREQIRQEVLTEQQQQTEAAEAAKYDEDYLGNEDRYRSLLATPDDQLSGDDYQWREDRKLRRAQHPHVERHYQTVAQQQIDSGWQAIQADLRGQMDRLSKRLGVDSEEFQGLRTWEAQGSHLYEAGQRSMQPKLDDALDRIRELEANESQHARFNGHNGLGSTRTAIGGGRSSSGAPPNDMETWIRGTLAPRG